MNTSYEYQYYIYGILHFDFVTGFALLSLSPIYNLQCGGDTITDDSDGIPSPYLLFETVTTISVKVTSNARVNLIGTHSPEGGSK